MSIPVAKAVLQQNFLFRDLGDTTIDKIAKLANRHSFTKGEIIFMQDDPGGGLYGVVSGQVRISSSAPSGKEVFLNIMEPGDVFGEIALIDGQQRTATATALKKAELFILDRHQFLELMESEPTIAIHMLKIFCGRLRWTSELIEEASLLNVRSRLAKRLLSLGQHHGTETNRGTQLEISQGELAQFLSISRQIVHRYLHEWRRNGCVELTRSRIIILDADALIRISGQSPDG